MAKKRVSRFTLEVNVIHDEIDTPVGTQLSVEVLRQLIEDLKIYAKEPSRMRPNLRYVGGYSLTQKDDHPGEGEDIPF